MCSNTRCCALTFGRWKLGNSGHILRHAVDPGGAAIRPGLLVHRELRRSNFKQCVKNVKCEKHSSNLLNVYNNWTNSYGDFINMASEVTVLLAEIRYIKGLAQCDMIHTVLFTLRAALSLPSCLGQKTTSLACSSEFVRGTRGSARFLRMSYQRASSETLQHPCWNENEMKKKKWNERWWSHGLVQDLWFCHNRNSTLGWLWITVQTRCDAKSITWTSCLGAYLSIQKRCYNCLLACILHLFTN